MYTLFRQRFYYCILKFLNDLAMKKASWQQYPNIDVCASFLNRSQLKATGLFQQKLIRVETCNERSQLPNIQC